MAISNAVASSSTTELSTGLRALNKGKPIIEVSRWCESCGLKDYMLEIVMCTKERLGQKE